MTPRKFFCPLCSRVHEMLIDDDFYRQSMMLGKKFLRDGMPQVACEECHPNRCSK